MKKFTLLASGLFFSVLSVTAQVVEQKQTAFMAKRTATWCTPCGTWGWTLFNYMYDARNEQAIMVELHASNTSQQYVPIANTMLSNWEVSPGTPAFYVNGKDETVYGMLWSTDFYATRDNVIAVIDSVSALTPLANSASVVDITGNTINVTTKTKFFEPANGNYYLGIYVTENDFIGFQSGKSHDAVHRNLFRGSMINGPAGTPVMGTQLISGSVTAGQEFNNTASMTINSNWTPANLRVFTVIYKLESGKYRYVNASKASMLTSTPATITTEFSAKLYPTVASAGQPISLLLENTTAESVNIHVTDQLGRTVQTLSRQITTGTSQQIDLAQNMNLAPGVYFVSVSQGSSHPKSLKFIIAN